MNIGFWTRSSIPSHHRLARIVLSYGGPGSWDWMHAETIFTDSDLAVEHRTYEIWNELAAFSGYPDRYKLQTRIWDPGKNRWRIIFN
jgi:hypothetical protein